MIFFKKLKNRKKETTQEKVNKEEDLNEKRVKDLIVKYSFKYEAIPREEIIRLLKEEFVNSYEGSSEYLRLLCGYLCCIGNKADAKLIKKIKYGIDMDVGCMIDAEFIDVLENEDEELRKRIKKELKEYYENYYK